MAKRSLSGFGKPSKPTFDEVTLVSLVDRSERPSNFVLSHDGRKREIRFLSWSQRKGVNTTSFGNEGHNHE